MTLLSCVKVGAGVGLATGLVSSSYFFGMTDRLEKESSTSAYGTAFIAMGCLLAGAPIGATMGAGFYATNRVIKHLSAAPLLVRVTIGALVGSAVGAKLGYELGKKV